jgi:hypothetical protein
VASLGLPLRQEDQIVGRTPNVPVRIPLDLAERIDDLRGLVPREAYVRALLSEAVERAEKEAKQ